MRHVRSFDLSIPATMQMFFSMLPILLGCLTLTTPSNAATVQYNLVNVSTSNDDATFLGSFDFNTSTDAVTNVNITGTGNIISPPDLFDSVSGTPTATQIDFCGGQPQCIELDVTTALTDPTIINGALDTLISPSNYNSLQCLFDGSPNGVCESLTGAVQAATPLPAALPLFATALGAMGLFGWRRKRKAKAVA